jgi:hypothetical protein
MGMKTIILTRTKITDAGPNQVTEYTNKANGQICYIQAGKEPFTWQFITQYEELKKNFKAILNKYVEQGIKQHDYKGGFDEATSELVVKVK